MNAARRLGLGTVQFGLDYGISNRDGRVGRDVAASILALARRSGIDTFDTAPAYGDSESVLGALLPDPDATVVTKVSRLGDADPSAVTASVRGSLRALGRDRVAGVMFHEAGDLLGPRGDGYWRALVALRDEGAVGRIGASVYLPEQVDALLVRYPVGIVQLPLNYLDARMVEGGQLARLAAAGVEVHTRSLFLQGLLLQDPAAVPSRFPGLAAALRGIATSAAAHHLTVLEWLLAWAFRQNGVARVLCGVTGIGELEQIVAAVANAERASGDLDVPAAPRLDARVLNPSRWGELG